MEIIEESKIINETRSGVSSISQKSDNLFKILKPTLDERVSNDLGPENDGGGGGATVVVRTKLVEKTEVSVVTMIQEDKDVILKNKEGEDNEVVENEKKGLFGNLVNDDESMKVDVILKNQEKGKDNMVKENEGKGLFGNLVNDDEGMKADDILKNQEEGEGNEVVETRKLGFFDNLFEGDEGMNVNSGENGTSLVMDVDEYLGGANGSEVNLVFENAGGDPMDVRLSGENESNKNGTEIIELKDDMNKNKDDEGIVETGEDNGNELAENDDAKNDAGNVENGEDNGSKLAETDDTNKNDNVEKGEDNGGELAENDDGEQDESEEEDEDHDFVVGDFVWGKIKSHPWWPGQIYDPSDASYYAATLKRKGRLLVVYFGDGSFSWCSPSQLKPFIDNFQEMSDQSDSKKFVNAVQTALEEVSRLVGAELMCKCQTVDRVENGGVVNSGIKEGVAVPKGNTVKVLMGGIEPVEVVSTLKDCATMEPGTRLLELELTVLKSWLSAFYRKKGGYLLPEYRSPKCIEGLEDKTKSDVNGPWENGNDKLFQRRKQKSVAELLGEDEPKIKKAKMSKDGGSSQRRRKALVVSVTPESDHESGGGGVEEGPLSSRQRKKSKYLSPPYLSPVGNGKVSVLGSGSFKEPKTESEKVPEMAAKQLEESFKSSSGKKSKRRLREGSNLKENNKTINADVDVNTVLHGLLRAALDPSAFVENNLPATNDFISSFRRSIFEEGSNYQTDGKKDSSVTLVIEFPPEATLPTKVDLLKTYKKFGNLIKKETQSDGSSAFVVFGNGSDAEAALAMSLEKKPFGDVKYHVSEEAVSFVKRTSRKAVAGDTLEDLAFVKQKLETMSEMVNRCGEGEMSAEVKASLEGGIKEVLDEVGKMKVK